MKVSSQQTESLNVSFHTSIFKDDERHDVVQVC